MRDTIEFVAAYPIWVKIFVVLLGASIALLLILFRPTSKPSLTDTSQGKAIMPEKTAQDSQSFVTRLKVWADIDADLYVDGRKVTTIDHRSGFDYAGAKIRSNPDSKLTIRSRGFEKTLLLWDLCRTGAEECEIRIGTDRLSDIQISEEEKRASMGSSIDVPDLLRELRDAVNSSARYWAAERLGYIGDKEAVTGLVEAMGDPEPYVQALAAEALARIGDPSALADVEAAYENYERKESYGYIFEHAIKDLKFVSERRGTQD